MKKTLRVLNRMVREGVIDQYAIGGAVAAVFYIEPINTNDLDIFFHLKDAGGKLDTLARSMSTCLAWVTKPKDIEGWPVQFLPIFNPLLEEAVEQANEIRFKRTKTRVM